MTKQTTEFTPEQEQAILERIKEARKKEQRAIAGDQGFREALMAIATKVQSGIYDPYVYEVMKEEYEKFHKENPTLAADKPKKEETKKEE